MERYGAVNRALLYRMHLKNAIFRIHVLPDRKKKLRFGLAPGTYRARIQYLETRPQSECVETTFDIADRDLVYIMPIFQHGPMPIRRKHAPLKRKGIRPVLEPNEALTNRLDNKS